MTMTTMMLDGRCIVAILCRRTTMMRMHLHHLQRRIGSDRYGVEHIRRVPVCE